MEKHPEQLLALASKALSYEDYQARWQIAYGLSQIKDMQTVAKPLLLNFTNDQNDYVRKRALAALEFLETPS